MYTDINIAWNIFGREHGMEIIDFKKKNEVVNKEQKSYNNSAMFSEKSLKINMLKIKDIVKLGIIIIMEWNIELLHMEYAIQSIVYLRKFI